MFYLHRHFQRRVLIEHSLGDDTLGHFKLHVEIGRLGRLLVIHLVLLAIDYEADLLARLRDGVLLKI